ncbi:MAG TPA: family 16 glycoside hydrolase [Chloroflexota bacterium]|jgi:hypothetical protein|nr:family 16 glycoside hydrolase [Chloroflexota bacterium]
MRRSFGRTGWLAAALALALVGGGLAGAQTTIDPTLQGRLLRAADGTLWLYRDGARYLMRPVFVSDEELANIPVGGAIERVDQALPAGAGPAATTAAVPGAEDAPTVPSTVPPGPASAAPTAASGAERLSLAAANAAANAPAPLVPLANVVSSAPAPAAAAPPAPPAAQAPAPPPAPPGPPGIQLAAPPPPPTPTPLPTLAPATPLPFSLPPPMLGIAPVFYQSDWGLGLAGWSGGTDWRVLGGMLVNDGTRKDSYLVAPVPAPANDYAVEAEIQWLRGGKFGIFLRRSDGNGYRLMLGQTAELKVDITNTAGSTSGSSGGSGSSASSSTLASRQFDPGQNWHLYRFEARGNYLRVIVDGVVFMESADNRFLTGRQVGLIAHEAQINVRAFRITAP